MSSFDDSSADDPTAGDDPTEEVGPDQCGALPDQCDVSPGERDQPPEDCSFTMQDELSEQFPIEPIPVVRGPDGLPQPVDVPLSFAPPFTHEHVVCIEDKRKYVELFEEELSGRYWWWWDGTNAAWRPPLATRQGSKFPDRFVARTRFDDNGTTRERKEFKPEEVVELWGVVAVKSGQDHWVPVRPIRERCAYYKRQVFNNDEQPDPTEPGHRIVFTNCTMRRSVGGAFLSLRDQAIYACDYRDPPDPQTVRFHLDAFDEKRLTEKAHTKLIPLFGLGGDDLVKGDEDDE
jgi:hypothetical protein